MGVPQVIGTAAYLSPEQVRGDRPTAASDVYSLSLVMLECLTGVKAYPGTPVESAMARLSRSPGISPELAEPLRSLLARMTATEPLCRPTASDVLQLLSDQPTSRGYLLRSAGAGAGAASALPETAPLTVADTQAMTAFASARPGQPATAVLPAVPIRNFAPGGRARHRRFPGYALLALPAAAAVVVIALLVSGSGSDHPAPTSSATTQPSSGATGVSAVLGVTSPTTTSVSSARTATQPGAASSTVTLPPAATTGPFAAGTAGSLAPSTPPGKVKGHGKRAHGKG